MAGKTKFDKEAAFKQIIGVSQELEAESQEMPVVKGKNKDRVQRSYFLDRDIDKALRRKALDQEMNLTETINTILRNGLADYLS